MKDIKTLFVPVWSTGIKPYTTGLFDGPFEMAKQSLISKSLIEFPLPGWEGIKGRGYVNLVERNE